MKAALWISLFCAFSAGIFAGIIFKNWYLEILLGMLAPWLIGMGTVIFVERIYLQEPTQLTAFMVMGFLGKMVFYAVYVLTALYAGKLQAEAFVVSLVTYFLALHAIEAFFLRSLFARSAERQVSES